MMLKLTPKLRNFVNSAESIIHTVYMGNEKQKIHDPHREIPSLTPITKMSSCSYTVHEMPPKSITDHKMGQNVTYFTYGPQNAVYLNTGGKSIRLI